MEPADRDRGAVAPAGHPLKAVERTACAVEDADEVGPVADRQVGGESPEAQPGFDLVEQFQRFFARAVALIDKGDDGDAPACGRLRRV